VCFDSFQGYNKPEEQKKRKREEANLKASELTAFSDSLFTLAGSSFLKADRWKSVYESMLRLANLWKYFNYLERKKDEMQEQHTKKSCVSDTDDWLLLFGSPSIAPGPSARYRTLSGIAPYR